MRARASALAVTDKPTKSDWETLAAKESRGRDLTRETFEGIKLDTVYGPEAAIDSGYPGIAPFTRGPYATMYAGRPWTIRQYAGFSTAEEIQRLLPPQPRRRAEGPERRLRPRHPPRLRQRQSARRRRRRHGGRRDRQRRGHEIAVRRHPARRDVGQHDHERRGASGHGLLHRRRRGAGRPARAAHRHDPERHPERVRGPQHLHLPARAEHADRVGRDRLLRARDAEVQLDLDQRLSHARGRGDGGAGARLHARRRHGICARGDGAGARRSTSSRRASASSSASA